MKTNLNYDQYIPTCILFGAGQLNNLHAQHTGSEGYHVHGRPGADDG